MLKWKISDDKHCKYIAENNFVKPKTKYSPNSWAIYQILIGVGISGRGFKLEQITNKNWEARTPKIYRDMAKSLMWAIFLRPSVLYLSVLYSHTVFLKATIWMSERVKFIHRIIGNHSPVSPSCSPAFNKPILLGQEGTGQKPECELILSKLMEDLEHDHTVYQEKFSESAYIL